MRPRTLFAALSLGLMAACAQMSPHEAVQNTNIRKTATAQNPRTRSDHDALTRYFEEAASEMRAKAEEQEKLLEHYEQKSYLYGREAQDLKSHTAALVRKYKETAEENIKEAAAHRQMALEQNRHNLAAHDGRARNGSAVEMQRQGSN